MGVLVAVALANPFLVGCLRRNGALGRCASALYGCGVRWCDVSHRVQAGDISLIRRRSRGPRGRRRG